MKKFLVSWLPAIGILWAALMLGGAGQIMEVVSRKVTGVESLILCTCCFLGIAGLWIAYCLYLSFSQNGEE